MHVPPPSREKRRRDESNIFFPLPLVSQNITKSFPLPEIVYQVEEFLTEMDQDRNEVLLAQNIDRQDFAYQYNLPPSLPPSLSPLPTPRPLTSSLFLLLLFFDREKYSTSPVQRHVGPNDGRELINQLHGCLV